MKHFVNANDPRKRCHHPKAGPGVGRYNLPRDETRRKRPYMYFPKNKREGCFISHFVWVSAGPICPAKGHCLFTQRAPTPRRTLPVVSVLRTVNIRDRGPTRKKRYQFDARWYELAEGNAHIPSTSRADCNKT